jgi:epoxide hydrolase-like protein
MEARMPHLDTQGRRHRERCAASRDARATPNRSNTMTELNTVDVPLQTPATRTATKDTSIRPFRVHVSDEAVTELRRRIQATRWPDKETVADRSQGAQLATLQELVRYWGSGYDWRKAEAKLNALPQFMTNIDGIDVHFIHVVLGTTTRSR